MKTIRNLIFFACLFFFLNPVQAQQSEWYDQVQREIEVAKQLYSQQKYVSAYREFEKIQKKVEPKSELYSEAEFYRSVSALHAGYRAGDKLLENFIGNYPESPYINRAWFNMGKSQFERKQYLRAIRSFDSVDRADLSASDRIEIAYQNGYANLMQDNTAEALKEFNTVRNSNNL